MAVKEMKKIKVMHFVAGLTSGGVEQMLCNYCGAMNKDAYEFVLAYQHQAVETCKEKIEESGCRTIRITARSENFIKNLIDGYRVIKKERPDIVHAHMNLVNFCALLPAYLLGVKVRISHSHIAETNRNILFRIMAAICKFLCVHAATDLMTCGQEAGIYLYGKRRMQKGKVLLVENAINLDYYDIDPEVREKICEQHKLQDQLIIGHVGRFSYQKNHEKLIHIFSEISKRRADAVLLLVGTGELEEQIKELVQSLNIQDKVIFYGTTKNMREVYSLIDVFVLPSRYEGFPVVSVEVQAARIPALFSDTVAPTCKLTELIEFMPLDETDENWAKKTLECSTKNRNIDITALKEKYDIKEKAKMLDRYYCQALSRGKVITDVSKKA